MSSVTVRFGSLTEAEMRVVVMAHRVEYDQHDQPESVMASYAREHDGGSVGPIIRLDGPSHYTVITLPLTADSARRVTERLARKQADDATWIVRSN